LSFDVKNYAVWNIFGIEVWINETIVNTWIIMAVLITLAIVVRIKLRKFKEIPSGFQNFIELIVEAFDKFVKDSAGEKLMFLGNWFFTVFAFILLSNISGLFGIRAPTADWTITIVFALCTFVLIHTMGIKYRKGGYIKSFFEPFMFKGKVPNLLLFPLNLIGELARPVSLSFRLFGNILAGMILMSLFYAMVPVFVLFGIPAFLHAYFDMFAGILHAYIFSILSLSFIAAASEAT
jgi:F-type H+-transporting ATPase subunit a